MVDRAAVVVVAEVVVEAVVDRAVEDTVGMGVVEADTVVVVEAFPSWIKPSQPRRLSR